MYSLQTARSAQYSEAFAYLSKSIWCLICISSLQNITFLLSSTIPSHFVNYSEQFASCLSIVYTLCICIAAWFLARIHSLIHAHLHHVGQPKYYTKYMFYAASVCFVSTTWLCVFRFVYQTDCVLATFLLSFSSLLILIANIILCVHLLPLSCPPQIKVILDFDYTFILLLALLFVPVIIAPIVVFMLASWPSFFAQLLGIWHNIMKMRMYYVLCICFCILLIYTLFIYSRFKNQLYMSLDDSSTKVIGKNYFYVFRLFIVAIAMVIFYTISLTAWY